MKPQGAHAHEDRLLDFAYGELPPTEAQLVEQHLHGCSRCSETLEGIRGVRSTMSRLPLESEPDAGLDSLLAYAQQAARRNAAGPEPAPRWWRRLLAPALGMAAMGVFGIVVHQVNREVDLSPNLQAEAPREKVTRDESKVTTTAAPAPAPAPAPVPVPAAAAPASPGPEQLHRDLDEEFRAADQRARPVQKKSPAKSKRLAEREDWSNAGSAGGFPEKKVAALDEYASGSLRSKREVASLGTGRSSPSRAQPAEPVLDDAPADMEAAPAAEAMALASESPSLGTSSRPSSVRGSAEYAQRAPGRTQAIAASPPPPPPAQAQAPERLAYKAEVAQQVQMKPAGPRPSLAELLRQADVASRSGDKAEEAAMLHGALAAGVRGAQRLEVLSRLCEVESSLGRRRSAIEFCTLVLKEAPGSSEARLAQRRLERELSESKPAEPAE